MIVLLCVLFDSCMSSKFGTLAPSCLRCAPAQYAWPHLEKHQPSDSGPRDPAHERSLNRVKSVPGRLAFRGHTTAQLLTPVEEGKAKGQGSMERSSGPERGAHKQQCMSFWSMSSKARFPANTNQHEDTSCCDMRVSCKLRSKHAVQGSTGVVKKQARNSAHFSSSSCTNSTASETFVGSPGSLPSV